MPSICFATARLSLPLLLVTLSLPAPPALAVQLTREEYVMCESRLPPTHIQVETATPTHQTVRGQRIPNLTALLATQRPINRGEWVLGTTTPDVRIRTTVGFNYFKLSGSQLCFRPTIQIHITAGEQRVAVAEEFAPGTCAYRHIQEHELRHVRANYELAKKTARYLEQQLKGAFGTTVFYGDSAAVSQQLQTTLQSSWVPAAQAYYQNEALKAHAQIDTPQEYAANGTACGGDIRRILAQYGTRNR